MVNTDLIVSDASFATILRAMNRPVRIGWRCVTSAQEAQAAFYGRIGASRDCSQLAGLHAYAASYKMMADGSWLAPGLFMRVTWFRAGVLNTKARCLEDIDKLCKSRYGPVESIDHILQTCVSTHVARCERHNRIARLLAKQLQRRGYFVMEEELIWRLKRYKYNMDEDLLKQRAPLRYVQATDIRNWNSSEWMGLCSVTIAGSLKAYDVYTRCPSS